MTSYSQSHVFIGERPQNNVHLLGLLVNGFCPRIINDRVEVHDVSTTESETTTMDHHHQQQQSADDNDEMLRHKESNTNRCRSRRPLNYPEASSSVTEEIIAPTTASTCKTTSDELPFEIAERPPSDVIGISKKIWEEKVWEGFCFHPTDAGSAARHQQHRQRSSSQDSCSSKQTDQSQQEHKGFCSILMDPYRNLCLNDKETQPPGGEECSIDSSSEESSNSVDLTPQSSPRSLVYEPQQPQQANRDVRRDLMPSISSVDCDKEDEYVHIDDDDGEELDELLDEPLIEFEDRRGRRMVQVFLGTVLVLYVTFAMLQNMDSTYMNNTSDGSKGINLLVQSKQKTRRNENYANTDSSFSSAFIVSPKTNNRWMNHEFVEYVQHEKKDDRVELAEESHLPPVFS